MSDDSDGQPPRVGYKQPPVEHRFVKGRSGNPSGRPPKQERSITLRQARRDLLGMLEAPIPISIDGKRKMVTGIEAIHLRLLRSAMAGHGPSLRFLYREHQKAVREHMDDGDFSFLEMAEQERIRKPVPKENEKFETKFLNGLRKRTKRL